MLQAIFIESYIRLVLTIIVIIALAYILFKFRATKNPSEDSLDIMQERLEKGEMTKEDYEEAKKRQRKQ